LPDCTPSRADRAARASNVLRNVAPAQGQSNRRRISSAVKALATSRTQNSLDGVRSGDPLV